jgi:hypothetical protein
MRGAPARAIQELAGHQDLTTTQRYMHLSPAAVESAIQLLDAPGGSVVRGNMMATRSTETGKWEVDEWVEWSGLRGSNPIGRFSQLGDGGGLLAESPRSPRLAARMTSSAILPNPLECAQSVAIWWQRLAGAHRAKRRRPRGVAGPRHQATRSGQRSQSPSSCELCDLRGWIPLLARFQLRTHT